ncbi:TPA_asm: hypothetical protein vir525_00048 [Caudoviricetes sp. vir525]|nr:TPA_asm: hypothetical protein vir525_00048 [Caudoviricetes sp. vir525]
MLGEVIPHAGCQALYHLEADGTDSSGNSRDLFAGAGILHTYGPGKFNNGLIPSGYTLYRDDSLGVVLGNKLYGISFWFKITTQPETGREFEFVRWNYYGPPHYTYNGVRVTYVNSSGALKIQLEPCAAGTLANFTATPGEWHKCDVTADGTTAYLYINGVKYIEATVGTTDPHPSNSRVQISGIDTEKVQGMMDEVAFFDYHRTEQEIVRQHAFEAGMML